MNLKVIINFGRKGKKNKTKLLLTLIYSLKQRQQINKYTIQTRRMYIYTKHLQCKL